MPATAGHAEALGTRGGITMRPTKRQQTGGGQMRALAVARTSSLSRRRT